MGRFHPPGWVPAYRHHKKTGKAYVRIGGRDVWLGTINSPESRAAYDRAIAEWLSSGRRQAIAPPPAGGGRGAGPTVTELLAAFRSHAVQEYPEATVSSFGDSARWVRELYGATPAADFGPLQLKAVRDAMMRAVRPTPARASRRQAKRRRGGSAARSADAGRSSNPAPTSPSVPPPPTPRFCRKTINAYVARVRQIFKWGVSEGLIPAAGWHGLQAVSGLRYGRGGLREKEPIGPVDDSVVDATVARLPAVVADMVRVQRLTGMRPGEVCNMTGAQLDTSGEVWMYKPLHHKTAHHGKTRVVPLGPRAQAILKPYLRRELGEPLFRPDESERLRYEGLRASRRTPLTPSQRERGQRRARAKRRRPPSDRYTSCSYRRAVERAAALAGVPDWAPNQLRHTKATELRRHLGLDVAGAVLGHTKLETTQVYAERSMELATAAALATG